MVDLNNGQKKLRNDDFNKIPLKLHEACFVKIRKKIRQV